MHCKVFGDSNNYSCLFVNSCEKCEHSFSVHWPQCGTVLSVQLQSITVSVMYFTSQMQCDFAVPLATGVDNNDHVALQWENELIFDKW